MNAMSLFHALCEPMPRWVLLLGTLSLGVPSHVAAKDAITDTTVCIPVDLDAEDTFARDPGFPVVRCVISDPSANDNQRRQNAQKTAVLAQVDPSAEAETEEAFEAYILEALAHPDLELPFDLNSLDGMSEVPRYVRFYLTEGRGRLGSYFARAGRYEDMIRTALDAQDAPQDLLWVVAIESNFKIQAVSHAGAAGLWQFMPRTARSRGMIVDGRIDERLDPEIATEKAIEYLLYQRERFGAWPLALAAYNAGSGHVRSEIRTWGVTELDAMERYGSVYQSARSYAAKIIALALIDRNRELFGVDAIVPDEPIVWETVKIDDAVRLSLIADAARVPVDELLKLNPALVGKAVPKGGWEVRLPEGTYERFVKQYDRVARRYGKEHLSVTLRFGETLAMIAERYGVPERVLRAVNGYGHREAVPYGTEVVVPQGSGSTSARSDKDEASSEPLTVVVPAKSYEYPDRTRVFYEVHTQDSLQDIATYFDVSVYELAAWNELSPESTLWQGMVLQVYTEKELSAEEAIYREESECRVLQTGSEEWKAWREEKKKATARRRRSVTVKKGDTVLKIAKRHGVKAADIVRWNGLRDSAHIVIGQKLYLSPRR